MSSPAKTRVAVLISGRGSNMLALADAAAETDFPAEVVAVIADKADAGGLESARERGIAAIPVPRKGHADKASHEAAIAQAIDESGAEFICLAGYMRLLSADFVKRYEGRILNIHPSLLPLFPGLDTHQRAIDAGLRVHGCTVHFVNEGMDQGAVIAQAAVPLLPADDVNALAARVLVAEHRLYRHALALVARGAARLGPDGRTRYEGINPAEVEPLIVP